MLKKILFASFIFTSLNTFAKYEPWNFNIIEVGIIKNNSLPNGFGPSEKDTIFEVQGTTRYNLLDLYWFVDRSNIFNDSDLSDKKNSDPNYVYAEFNPRISIDGLIGKDLSIGPVNEWFLSYLFDYDNKRGFDYGKSLGIKKHYFGIGNYLNVPGFEYFKTNFYARYIERNYFRNEKKWDGFMLNASYGATLYRFENGMKVGFSGWIDYVFGAKDSDTYNEYYSENQTTTSLQWQNQLRLFLNDNLSVSYTYQINHNFSEVHQYASGSNSTAVGVHYSVTF